jgi:hypothetical protein
MLVAALRTDNPLGGAPLVYDDAVDVFALQGLGEVSAAKLLDLENRRQLVWADPVTREWALETAAIRVRKEAEAKATARAAEAAAAAAAAAAAEAARIQDESFAAQEQAMAHGVIPAVASGSTLVFAPPVAKPRRPAGVRAAATRFALPESDRDAATVVWSEPATDDFPPAGRDAAAGAVAPGPAETHAAAVGAWAAGFSGARANAADAQWADPTGWQAPASDNAPSVVTRRADRRSALKEHEHRRAASAAWLRVVFYLLIAVAVVVVLLVVQHGGF